VVETRTPSVKIEQPKANKATAIMVAGVSGFLGFVLLTKIDAAGANLVLIAVLASVLVLSYKAIQVVAVANVEGIEVRNLIRSAHLKWVDIAALTVGTVGKGSGMGITVNLDDGSTLEIEASFGPWYQTSPSAETEARCARFVERIDEIRRNAANAEERVRLEASDALKVRASSAADVDTVAKTLDAAWHETYADILPGYRGFERSPAEDAEVLRELLDGTIYGAGSLLVERSGTIVGASVFGPTHGEDVDGFTEVYMLYVRADEIGGGAGRLLVLRTFGAIRASGSRGIIGHVQVNNARFRNQIEAMGIQQHGEADEQIWHGFPVSVVEYRLNL
jgi:hypothetical protein